MRERVAAVSAPTAPTWRSYAFVSALAAILSFGACEPITLGDGPRKQVLRDAAEHVILPTYEDLAARAAELHTAVQALAATPSATALAAAQAAWRAARTPWMHAQAFRIGPIVDALYDSRLDQWPVEAAQIEALVAGEMVIDDAFVDALGASRKGFHAIEHLLFDAAGGDAAVLARLTTDARAARRLALVVVYAEDLAQGADALRAAWAPGEGDYLTRFVEIGSPEAAFMNIKAAVDALVNQSVFLSELVAVGKLGKPMGKQSGGEPRPELEESAPSDQSLDDMLANLAGLRAIYEGSGAGQGLSRLVVEARPAIDRQVRTDLAAAEAALAAIPRPLAAAFLAHAPELEIAYAAVKALQATLATEVVAALGATLSFNDNDGD